MSATTTFQPLGGQPIEGATCVCIGAGRFLRAVLVPALREAGESVIVAQPRGTSFGEYMAARPPPSANTYEVDCVAVDGSVATTEQTIVAVGSLGSAAGRAAFMALPPALPRLRVIGVGVTEAGVAMDSGSMLHLAEFLHRCMQANPGDRNWKLAVINTDNVPDNGDKIGSFVRGGSFVAGLPAAEGAAFAAWLDANVCFVNSMVDRIVAAREGESEVPRAEPLPKKALVLEDLHGALPAALAAAAGVVVRSVAGEIETDHCLKLRILNAVHSAIVYLGALTPSLRTTDAVIAHPAVLAYCGRLFEQDIATLGAELGMDVQQAVRPIYDEWIGRLQHPHFGLDCFWVTQNASQKLGIRFWPTALAVLKHTDRQPSDALVFAIAAMLRFLTPAGAVAGGGEGEGVFEGRMDVKDAADTKGRVDYVRGLAADAGAATYQYKDGDGTTPRALRPIGGGDATLEQVLAAVLQVLEPVAGFDACGAQQSLDLAGRIAALLHRMLSGGAGALDVLLSLSHQA
jgi:mannitol-1-phosphate/altronate dehydrogenase